MPENGNGSVQDHIKILLPTLTHSGIQEQTSSEGELLQANHVALCLCSLRFIYASPPIADTDTDTESQTQICASNGDNNTMAHDHDISSWLTRRVPEKTRMHVLMHLILSNLCSQC